jgi:AcrR family transcriptional regulator
MTKEKKKPKPGTVGRGMRTRLSPEVRRKQILDAALFEFSAMGFAATSISRIAERVGISKANVYVHFTSKDQIFETLLQSLSSVGRSQGNWSKIQEAQNVTEFIDNLVDVTYEALTPEALTIMRLLISEGHRIPGVLAKWHEANLQARAERQAVIDEQVAAGRMKANPLTENFELAMTPLVYVAVAKLTFGDAATEEVERIKDTHRKVLHLLLEP